MFRRVFASFHQQKHVLAALIGGSATMAAVAIAASKSEVQHLKAEATGDVQVARTTGKMDDLGPLPSYLEKAVKSAKMTDEEHQKWDINWDL